MCFPNKLNYLSLKILLLVLYNSFIETSLTSLTYNWMSLRCKTLILAQFICINCDMVTAIKVMNTPIAAHSYRFCVCVL